MPSPEVRISPHETPPEFVARYERDLPDDTLLRADQVRGAVDVDIPLLADPGLVASADGAISDLLLTVPAWAFGAPQLWSVYEAIFVRLPETLRFVVLTHRASAAAIGERLGELGVADRVTLLAAGDELGFSIWAEDGYVVVRGSGGEGCFVEPYSFARYADALVADLVTRGTSLRLYQAPLYFQGGNLLIGDDFFLIGADYVANTLAAGVLEMEPGAGDEERMRVLFAAYEEYLDGSRRPVPVGSRLPVPRFGRFEVEIGGETWIDEAYLGNRPGTVQPLFHIDMFMSLAGRGDDGRYQVLVGDPRLAAEVLGVHAWPYSMVAVFDDIADQLAGAGFAVHRNPLPMAHVADPERRVRTWYFATGNNALVEIAGGRGRVWLPSYGHEPWPELAETDEANRRVWEGLGFECELMPDFHPFAQGLGALHCIKKYLARAGG